MPSMVTPPSAKHVTWVPPPVFFTSKLQPTVQLRKLRPQEAKEHAFTLTHEASGLSQRASFRSPGERPQLTPFLKPPCPSTLGAG